MVSLEVRQTSKAAAKALVFAAAALPCAGFSQAALEATAGREDQILDTIQQEQARNGPYSELLIEPLTALGLLYEEDEDLSLAGAAIEQARQVVRANYGLYSLEEAPLLRQAIRIEEASDNLEAAWELEQQLLNLTGRHPYDLRTVPILSEIAEKRMEVLQEYVAGGFPPQIVLGCYYDPVKNVSCNAGSRRVVIGSIEREAQRYSSHAKFLTSAYANSVSPLARINAFLRDTDQQLLLLHRSHAGSYGQLLQQYEQVYQHAENEGIGQASIEQIFSPAIPVFLPAVLPNPLLSKETAESTGYIEVAFDVTQHGRGENVVILSTTPSASRRAQRKLVRLIGQSSFRPRVTNGEIVDSESIVVRYYLNE